MVADGLCSKAVPVRQKQKAVSWEQEVKGQTHSLKFGN